MATLFVSGTIWRESEFEQLPNGVTLTGDCGPNALAMGYSWSTQSYHSSVSVYQAMLAAKRCDGNGVSDSQGLHDQAVAFQLPVLGFRGYGEPWSDFKSWFLTYAGRGYILMETANGQALVDYLTGKGENATNLHYHFIGIVGHHDGGWCQPLKRDLPAGWIVVDGDNYDVGNVLQFYPEDVLAASQPCAALAIGASTTMASPYTRNPDGTATDTRTHNHLGAGFADYVFTHNLTAQCVWPETYVGSWCFAAFDNGLVLYYDAKLGVRDDHAWYVAEQLYQLAHGTTPATDPEAVKDAAFVAQLKAELAAL